MRIYLSIWHYVVTVAMIVFFLFCGIIWMYSAQQVPQIETLSAQELEQLVSVDINDGWVSRDGAWYYYQNGEMLKNQWIQNIYYVGGDGAMLRNTVTPDGYTVDEDGIYVSGQ